MEQGVGRSVGVSWLFLLHWWDELYRRTRADPLQNEMMSGKVDGPKTRPSTVRTHQ